MRVAVNHHGAGCRLRTFALALTLAAPLSFGPAADSAVAASELTFLPTADAKVRSDKPTKNYGTTVDLRAKVGNPIWRSYLRFTVAGAGTVTGARLRLFVTDGSPSSGTVHLTGAGWAETSITFSTAPAIGAQVGSAVPAPTIGTWIEIPLFGAVTGDGEVNLAIVSPISNSVSYNSRQSAHPPELIVSTDTGGGPPGAPVADFGAQPLLGLAPMTVNFTDLSSPAATSWTWDFQADGIADSTAQNPSFSYTTAGIYSVTLDVSNTEGSDSLTRASLVDVAAWATVETTPVPHSGDAADDPAIWIHPTDPALSTIIGTDKGGGIAVYDLDGNELQYRPDGIINNVDLRPDVPLGGSTETIVVASFRPRTIAVYRVDPITRLIAPISARPIVANRSFAGICIYQSALSGKLYVFTARTSDLGDVEQWELFDNGAGLVDGRFVRSFTVGSASEGCVADDELGWFYVGEETVGVWRYGAEPDSGSARVAIDTTGSGGHLVADVEGLALTRAPGGIGYLIASSQGNDTFAIYRREPPHTFIKRFAIRAAGAIDGVTHTDGLEVTLSPLGPRYPGGLLVVQDDSNDGLNQNFKLVPWPQIVEPSS